MKTLPAPKVNPLRTAAVVALACLLGPICETYAITITHSDDANSLASTLLAPGVTLVAGSATLTGATTAVHGFSSAGLFTNGLTTGIGINQGILLTSGDVYNVGDVNTSDSIGSNFLGAGDAALDALIPGYETHDATVLEFKFKTNTGNLYFNFSFGSEEYNEWVGSPFNDVFGFFVDGVNIAVLPGTNTPISINNVNAGNPLFNVGPMNALYYRNNETPSNGTAPFPFEYDGFTKVFTVSATNLSTSGEHTIRLAVADAGDNVLDTGVFIQANSFGSIPTPPDDDPYDDDDHVPDGASSLLLVLLGGLGIRALGSRRRRC